MIVRMVQELEFIYVFLILNPVISLDIIHVLEKLLDMNPQASTISCQLFIYLFLAVDLEL